MLTLLGLSLLASRNIRFVHSKVSCGWPTYLYDLMCLGVLGERRIFCRVYDVSDETFGLQLHNGRHPAVFSFGQCLIIQDHSFKFPCRQCALYSQVVFNVTHVANQPYSARPNSCWSAVESALINPSGFLWRTSSLWWNHSSLTMASNVCNEEF